MQLLCSLLAAGLCPLGHRACGSGRARWGLPSLAGCPSLEPGEPHTCRWRPRRRVRPPRWCSSPCSAPSRCLLKCGRGRLGLKSELSMPTGASMMAALVTGPGGGERPQGSGVLPTLPRSSHPPQPTFERHCADALLALNVPEPHRLVVGARQQHRAVSGHRETGHLVPGDRRRRDPRLPRGWVGVHKPASLPPASPVSLEDLPGVLLRAEALLSLAGLGAGKERAGLRQAGPGRRWAGPAAALSLTQAQRSTWKMEPSLPPQNMWCSARSMVTAMMPTSKRTDSSSSPEDISHSWGHAVRLGPDPQP